MLLALLLFALSARAAEVPLCPAGLSTPLGEQYPARAVTISDDIEGTAFVVATVQEIFAAQSEPLPYILINTTPERFPAIQAALAQTPGWTPPKTERLRLVTATGRDDFGEVSVVYNWQQDFVKGFFDPATGAPVSRVMPTYDEVGDLKERTQVALASIGVRAGPPLPAPAKQNGYSGGNFDVVPGGLCVLGASDLAFQAWKAYAAGVCPGLTPLKAPSQWTSAGHADELYKIIPTGPGACDFALAFPSPRRALSLLEQAPTEPAYERGSYTPAAFTAQLTRLSGLGAVCGTYQSELFEAADPYRAPPIDYRTDQGLRILSPKRTSYLAGGQSCDALDQGGLRALLRRDPVFRAVNERAARAIDDFRDELLAKIAAAQPACPRPKVLELPALFSGSLVENADGTQRLGTLAENADAGTVFPNPVNAVYLNKTLLVPRPFNASFQRDIEAQLNGVGVRARFVETLKSHAHLGNLHCATQVFRYCQPRK